MSKVSEILDSTQPDTHNQAIMEFGATLCTPQKPNCPECPLQSVCHAYSRNQIQFLPVKTPKLPPRKRYFHYIMVKYRNGLFLKKRPLTDIWRGLYEFPMIETKDQSVPSQEIWQQLCSKNMEPVLLATYKHQLSHQTIYASFYLTEVNENIFENSPEYIYLEKQRVSEYPVHKLISKFLEEFSKTENNV